MKALWAAGRSGALLGSTSPVVAASLIKVPILLAVLRAVDADSMSLGAVLPVSAHHRVGGTGWLGTSDRESADLATLARAMIDASDNTATNVLIDAVGFAAVADAGAAAGLTSTVLARHMMDTSAQAAGRENYTSALDMVRVLLALPRLLSAVSWEFALSTLRGQQIPGALVDACPPGWTLAHKTGTLPGYAHDAGLLVGASAAGESAAGESAAELVAVSVLGSCEPGEEEALAPLLDEAAAAAVGAVLSD